MAYIPKQGDVVHIEFDPAAGREMKGDHFALVVSATAFNRLGLAIMCPISQGAADAARSFGLVVTLMGSGTHTQGAVQCQHLKALDWRGRKARFKETVPLEVLDDVLARIAPVLTRE